MGLHVSPDAALHTQKFRGQNLIDLLIKSPDILNDIRAVLIRFGRGVFAALGDIRKLYNSAWLEDQKVHLHHVLWRDSEEEDIQEYAIARVNKGDKPAGCIAPVAMQETANLPKNVYVDDILPLQNNLCQLKQITTNVERILEASGLCMTPLV